jgi:hypothetical protein
LDVSSTHARHRKWGEQGADGSSVTSGSRSESRLAVSGQPLPPPWVQTQPQPSELQRWRLNGHVSAVRKGKGAVKREDNGRKEKLTINDMNVSSPCLFTSSGCGTVRQTTHWIGTGRKLIHIRGWFYPYVRTVWIGTCVEGHQGGRSWTWAKGVSSECVPLQPGEEVGAAKS